MEFTTLRKNACHEERWEKLLGCACFLGREAGRILRCISHFRRKPTWLTRTCRRKVLPINVTIAQRLKLFVAPDQTGVSRPSWRWLAPQHKLRTSQSKIKSMPFIVLSSQRALGEISLSGGTERKVGLLFEKKVVSRSTGDCRYVNNAVLWSGVHRQTESFEKAQHSAEYNRKHTPLKRLEAFVTATLIWGTKSQKRRAEVAPLPHQNRYRQVNSLLR